MAFGVSSIRCLQRVVLSVALASLCPETCPADFDEDFHRFRFAIGVAAFKPGGNDWGRVIADAGFGDTQIVRHGADWLSWTEEIQHPSEASDHDGLFFATTDYMISSHVGLGLGLNHGEPFSAWSGYRASDGTSEAVRIDPSPRVTTLLAQAVATVRSPVNLTIGIGPSFHWTEVKVNKDDGAPTARQEMIGATARASVEYVYAEFRGGLTAQYSWVGDLEVTEESWEVSEFPTSQFSMDYGFVAVHIGFGIPHRDKDDPPFKRR
jgi:hypothetical protein